jgi:hypothetical protein
MKRGNYVYGKHHASYLCIGDMVYADGKCYHITAVSTDSTITELSTKEGQDLVYLNYTLVESSCWYVG